MPASASAADTAANGSRFQQQQQQHLPGSSINSSTSPLLLLNLDSGGRSSSSNTAAAASSLSRAELGGSGGVGGLVELAQFSGNLLADHQSGGVGNSGSSEYDSASGGGIGSEDDRLLSPSSKAKSSCCNMGWFRCCQQKEFSSRTVWIGRECLQGFPPNVIRNQKYNILTFLPLVLYNQFKFFLNMFFLVMALSQFIPALQIGYLYTYWLPLGFVLAVTTIREAIDDFRRFQRDREVNSSRYAKLTPRGRVSVASAELKVGDIVFVDKGSRVPADMVLLRTSEHSGSCFIRTDQLDGETDWKLRIAVPATQKLACDEDLLAMEASVYAEKPQKDIHSFIGKVTNHAAISGHEEEPLSIENTVWANTVIASGTAIGVIVYSGPECRATMNNSAPRSKVGLIDLELNQLTKLLFAATVVLSFVMVALKGFYGPWWLYFFRFILLFSYLIPISLRVNLDLGKIYYSLMVQRDKQIPGTVARSTTIPEELGRITYLLSDKTGTLTQNVMVFKKLHLGTAAYSQETFDEIQLNLKQYFNSLEAAAGGAAGGGTAAAAASKRMRKTAVTRVSEAVKALALCHNVTPVYDEEALLEEVSVHVDGGGGVRGEEEAAEADQGSRAAMAVAAALAKRGGAGGGGAGLSVTYQASSPDEVALVEWSGQMGLTLIDRTLTSLKLRTPLGDIVDYGVLQIFPFTSETKRMGIILREERTGEIVFYMKGADVVMSSIVQYNDWLEEEVDNMAREGLRTLVVAKKSLSQDQYLDFESRYIAAKCSVVNRGAQVAAVIESLERDMELLCVTGVEDKLQDNVRNTLEQLRNAGVKVWMLTGDKLETATCIAKSSRLVSKTQDIHLFKHVTNRSEAHQELNAFRRKQDTALVIKGDSLEVCLEYYEHEMMELATACPAVVCCRCSPEQKAVIVRLIQQHTDRRTAAIGDGGNDVSMIQAASVGIGIVGKEGKQASLAADFSLTQFSHVAKLILVHGRNSYKRSASLSQFVIHRGLIITTMQAIFSAAFYFSSVPLYPGALMVGYATIYTMFPVFSLVLDTDVSPAIALTYPELYKDLTKGRSLSYKTFFIWTLISIYQGGVIMFLAILLFEDEFIHVVSISFTALILTELLMVALTIRNWHWLMILAEFFSLFIYALSVIIFEDIFDPKFFVTTDFWWKVSLITAVSCVPLYILKVIRKKVSPPSYQKLQ